MIAMTPRRCFGPRYHYRSHHRVFSLPTNHMRGLQETLENMSSMFSLVSTLEHSLAALMAGVHPRCRGLDKAGAVSALSPARQSLRRIGTSIVQPFTTLTTNATQKLLANVYYSNSEPTTPLSGDAGPSPAPSPVPSQLSSPSHRSSSSMDMDKPSAFVEEIGDEIRILSSRLSRLSSRYASHLAAVLEQYLELFDTGKITCVPIFVLLLSK